LSVKLSFTLILPLFPRLLEFYRSQPNNALLESIFIQLNTFKSSFHRPISSRFDVVLLGGALGSLFSFLQAIASPIIGALSDRYGRRTALLYSMAGNIASVALWVCASTFPIFLASRVVGGLSEGNVQLANAIAADVSTAENRGQTLALVGVAFSLAFTFGPLIGAWLSSKTLSLNNPFMTAALFSLGLLLVETMFIYFKLPETRKALTEEEKRTEKEGGLIWLRTVEVHASVLSADLLWDGVLPALHDVRSVQLLFRAKRTGIGVHWAACVFAAGRLLETRKGGFGCEGWTCELCHELLLAGEDEHPGPAVSGGDFFGCYERVRGDGAEYFG